MQLKTPIAFIFFNRADTTMKVLDTIRQASPEKLYLISDGARENRTGEEELVRRLRNTVENGVDWPCTVFKNYVSNNMGCRKRVSSGISWVLEQEENTIILEDDIVPLPEFFPYCEELLERYKEEEHIIYISGNNLYTEYECKASYLFSKYPSIWGWATWRRAWNLYDDNMEAWEEIKKTGSVKQYYGSRWSKFYEQQIEMAYTGERDTWDYQWEASRMYHHGLGIIPKYNLVDNIGFNRDDATHTQGESMYDFTRRPLAFPLIHPEAIEENIVYDKNYMKDIISKEFERWTIRGKITRRIRMLFKK